MIPLVVTCDPSRFHLLRPFVDHYRRYGVNDFYINLHFDIGYSEESFSVYVAQANSILASLGLSLHSVYSCPFDAMAVRRHHDAIQKTIASHSPWIIWTDIDEFHEYPDELSSLIAYMEAHNLDFIRGALVDRMARVGFPSFREEISIWEQFPLGTDITRSVLRGWVDKIMISRACVALTPGHHKVQHSFKRAFDGVHPVHHFKWDASVVSRLKRRLEKDWKQRCPWWVQSQKALLWMEGGATEPFSGLRVYDFRDDVIAASGGPHGKNPNYMSNSLFCD